MDFIFLVLLNTGLHLFSWRCLNSINENYCDTWREIPFNSFMTTKTIIKFVLDGNWSKGFATFFAYLALDIIFNRFTPMVNYSIAKEWSFRR